MFFLAATEVSEEESAILEKVKDKVDAEKSKVTDTDKEEFFKVSSLSVNMILSLPMIQTQGSCHESIH